MATPRRTTLRFIDRELRRIEIATDHVIASYPLNPVPDALFQRLVNLVAISEATEYTDKPAVCTNTSLDPFPVNYAHKIVRLTLNDDVIVDRIDEIEGDLLSLQGKPYSESEDKRREFYQNLFLDETQVDRFRLGAIEMYGSNTYTNIQNDPRVCLGFHWHDHEARVQRGIQVNAIAEIVPQDDPFFRYMSVLRQLFVYEFLELHQPEYICAYKFWISEVREKHLDSQRGFIPDEDEE